MAAACAGTWAYPAAAAEDDRQRFARVMEQLPRDFASRVGASHVGGRYHLTGKPFLIEGAEKLLELGTRLGKFWFTPARIAERYPFNSKWGQYGTLLDLARSEYFDAVFEMSFATIFLESSSGWRRG